jgi:hypothetical protein
MNNNLEFRFFDNINKESYETFEEKKDFTIIDHFYIDLDKFYIVSYDGIIDIFYNQKEYKYVLDKRNYSFAKYSNQLTSIRSLIEKKDVLNFIWYFDINNIKYEKIFILLKRFDRIKRIEEIKTNIF